jgi:hypothetical protein
MGMSTSTQIVASSSILEPGAHALAKPRGGFYFWMAVALAVTIFLGFSPSFYLRSVLVPPLRAPPAPTPLLIVHAVVMTVWMLLLLAQAGLVKSGRVPLHRKLGVFAASWAGVVVVLGVIVPVVRAHTALAPGAPSSGIAAFQRNFNTLGSIAEIANFAVLVMIAVRFRRRPDVHRRLMTIATVSLTQPATGRFAVIVLVPLVPGLELGTARVIGVALSIAFVAAVALHDFVELGRLHRVTVWGVIPYVLLEALIFTPFYGSATAANLTHWLADLAGS